jgi:hypothetical protein
VPPRSPIRRFLGTFLVGLACLWAAGAGLRGQTLVGQLIDADYYYSDRSTRQIDGTPATVSNATVEFPNLHVGISLDFTGSTLTVVFPSGGYGFFAVPYNGLVVTNLSSSFSQATLLSSVGPFTSDRIGLSSNVLDLNFAGLNTSPGDSFTLLLVPVPEPATWLMTGGGLAYLAVRAGQRRRSKAG